MPLSAPGSSLRPEHPLLSAALTSTASHANGTVDTLLTDLQDLADHASRLASETFDHSTVMGSSEVEKIKKTFLPLASTWRNDSGRLDKDTFETFLVEKSVDEDDYKAVITFLRANVEPRS